MGADVDFLTAIGDDAFGRGAVALWEEEGVRAEAVVADAPTMSAPILLEPSGQNRIVIVPGALERLSPAHVDAFADRMNETDAPMVRDAGGVLVLTLGEQGAQIGEEHVPAFPATAVDTTGAGDAFTAAFAVAVAEGIDPLEAVRWGCAAGAHMVEHPGVVPGLPIRAELEKRLSSEFV